MKRLFQLAALGFFATTAVLARAADLAILSNGYEIRHERREAVGTATRLYLSSDPRGGYVDIPTEQIQRYEIDESVRATVSTTSTAEAFQPARTVDIRAAVDAASKAHAIDADFIASVIHAESSFNPRAVSPKGAQGLMQLMPGTALTLGVKDSFDANANVDGGTRYLRELLLRYDNDMAKALAAYNAGPNRVDRYHGVPPYLETRQYVARIIREFNQKKLAAKAAPTKKAATKKKTVADSEPRSTLPGGQ